jgi:quinolinate synthase
MNNELLEEIIELKKEKNASILAHFYQDSGIQDIADHIADSLGMAYYGRETDCEVLLVAGVLFMGETSKIISPEKTVLVPDLSAGCSLADNCPADKFKEFISKYPQHKVVSYVNCSVEVKALSNILCTSSNAVKIINSFPKDTPLIFGPDKHLGAYLKKHTNRHDMILWDGSCIVHENFKTETLLKLKLQHKDALVLAHPECPEAILELSDFIGSTSALLKYSTESSNNEFIIATESGIIHQMEKKSPEKKFYPLPNAMHCNCAECPHMRKNSLEKIRDALKNLAPEIKIEENLRQKALIPLERMLEISKN